MKNYKEMFQKLIENEYKNLNYEEKMDINHYFQGYLLSLIEYSDDDEMIPVDKIIKGFENSINQQIEKEKYHTSSI